MKRLAIALLLGATASAPLSAQTTKVKEEKPGLFKLATIKPEVATTTALAKVPNGKVQAAELEQEDGKLIYSFDIKVPGKAGIEEVAVDAKTGKVLSVEHETPTDEATEARADKAKADSLKKKATAKRPPKD